jgi:hypothetical protein
MQLYLNLDNLTEEEHYLATMQRQIDELVESMGKVRRKMFAELGEVKKICSDLKEENAHLRQVLGIGCLCEQPEPELFLVSKAM